MFSFYFPGYMFFLVHIWFQIEWLLTADFWIFFKYYDLHLPNIFMFTGRPTVGSLRVSSFWVFQLPLYPSYQRCPVDPSSWCWCSFVQTLAMGNFPHHGHTSYRYEYLLDNTEDKENFFFLWNLWVRGRFNKTWIKEVKVRFYLHWVCLRNS